ncbi:MAG: hypothetical protein FWC28_06360 [Proteobacteria bacterium]|nr:hypothetical protein [Pseudomonadota bacterium]
MQVLRVCGLGLLVVLLAACSSDSTKECKGQPDGTECEVGSDIRKCEGQPGDTECEDGSSTKKCEGQPDGTKCESSGKVCYQGTCKKEMEVPCESGGTSCGVQAAVVICYRDERVCKNMNVDICDKNPENAPCRKGDGICKEGHCCILQPPSDFCASMAAKGRVCGEITDVDGDCGNLRTENCGEDACTNGCLPDNTCRT